MSFAKLHLPSLFEVGSPEHQDAVALSGRLHEFSQFLVRTLGVEDVRAAFPHRVTYHDSCHLLRELGVKDEPRRLLARVRGLEFVELTDSDTCCGFGGVFALQPPELSLDIGRAYLEAVREAGSSGLVSLDHSCLMHLQNVAGASGLDLSFFHLAELLIVSRKPESVSFEL